MPLELSYPNHLLGTRRITRYNWDHEAARVPSAAIQFPSAPTTPWNGWHRSPAAVPSTSPYPTTVVESFLGSAAPPPSPSSVYATAPSSPMSSSPPPYESVFDQAVTSIVDHTNGWSAIHSVVGDPVTRSLMYAAIGSQLLHHIPSYDDVEPVMTYDDTTCFRLRPSVMFLIGSAFSRKADFAHCASTDHNPYVVGGRPDLPLGMDECSLEESAIPIPGLSLFRGYSIHRLLQRRFSSRDEAVDFIRLAKVLHNYYLMWIANQIRHFIRFGVDSKWNWGAGIGMCKVEFLRRNNVHFPILSHGDLEHIMSHQILRNAADFACAFMLSRRDNRLISVHRAGQVVLAIWPFANPAQDAAELYALHHMGELRCSVRVLGQIVLDNQPGDSSTEEMDSDESDDSDDSI
ncbi:hypothetical protein DFH06DRAFT_1411939 [Mycena polygramma]|nr:hypothetical protein DFH06DRAFT_1424170 [Mycena polygramma]KAJ7656148.1 hypothetical protein DFH06DRAFT_1411939 [Mycena polygramma]